MILFCTYRAWCSRQHKFLEQFTLTALLLTGEKKNKNKEKGSGRTPSTVHYII